MNRNLFQRASLLFSTVLLFSLIACAQQVEPTAQQPPVKEEAPAQQVKQQTDAKIQWMSLEEALAAQAKDPKPLFVDIYTDWCKWCVVMDKKTFCQAEVCDYVNTNYYPVKFNAEKEDAITIKGKEYKLMNAGRRNIHTFAYTILEGKLSYPSYVVLDENLQTQGVMKGYKEATPFLQELKQLQL